MPRKPKAPPKPCKRCESADAIAGEKYCKSCRSAVLSEIEKDGYFTEVEKPKRASEHLGRSSLGSKVIGGTCEFGHDGDDD
jgi:hypothetical protein